MGAQTPLCRGTFIGDNGAGCLVTAAVRACGVTVWTTEDVLRTAYKLWPWLLTQVTPIENPLGDGYGFLGVWEPTLRTIILADYPYHQIQAPTLCWIIAMFDGDPAMSTDWIIEQIRQLEEYVQQDKQAYLDSVSSPQPGPATPSSSSAPAPVTSGVSR